MAERFTVLIMAAGHGTRMRSATPKVLHPLAGRPMIEWVIQAARAAGADRVMCVTRPGDGVAQGLPETVECVEQTEGEGTGAAVLAAGDELREAGGTVVVLSADHPLVSSELVAALLARHREEAAAATLLTSTSLDPAGYGRIMRDSGGEFERIAETKVTKGLPAEVLEQREVNIGAYAFQADDLIEALSQVEPESGEVYLTGVFPKLVEAGKPVAIHRTDDTLSALGVNDRVGLMEAERVAQGLLREEHARAGVTFLAPDTAYLDVGVEIGQDTVVGPSVTIRGSARIGSGVTLLHSYLHDCEVRDGASIGPFAYLRPGTVVRENAKIGTFVEAKNSDIGAGAKVPHLSYLGDADVGEGANIAAGNITANYDGFDKHRTVIGKRAKTGVDTTFVAPVRVGDGAYTGAGSVIAEDVPDGALGISRPEQKNVEGYAQRKEEEKGS